MNVDINETWNDQQIGTFNYGIAFLGKRGGNGNNAALVHGHIHLMEAAVALALIAQPPDVHVRHGQTARHGKALPLAQARPFSKTPV